MSISRLLQVLRHLRTYQRVAQIVAMGHKLTSAHPYSIKAVSLRLRLEREIFQFNHISNGARTTRLLNFNLISRAELSNGDVEASSASPERSPRAMRVEVGSGISDGEWLCCIRR